MQDEIQEKPILFNSEMVRAVLAGKKTQTRRVIKSTPVHVQLHEGGFVEFHTSTLDPMYSNPIKCPYGKAGDQLWVRETWQAQNQIGQWWHEVAKAERNLYNWAIIDRATDDGDLVPPKWIPSIFMPRKFSRTQLLVENVRVERVQDMTHKDWKADFAPTGKEIKQSLESFTGAKFQLDHSVKLWDAINAKRGFSWNANPWVWVVEFSVLEVK